MLRRRLTCSEHPPRKSKIRRGSRGFEVSGHSGLNHTCNMTEMSVQSVCEGKTGEEAETVSSKGCQRHLDTSPFMRRLAALRQVFSAWVSCLRCSTKPGERGSHGEGEYHPVTIFNRHTRESVDLNAVCGASATEMHRCTNAGHKSAVEEWETIKSGTFKLFNPVAVVRSKAKSLGFWRQKPKKPAPFFQEHIGETNECIRGEVIVLANEHTDETMIPSSYPENEVRCYPEMLTVRVDVSNVILGFKDKNAHAEASKTPSCGHNNVDVMAGREGNLRGENTQNDKENLSNVHEEENINTPNVMPKRSASEHPAERDETRLYATFSGDSFPIHHNAAAENNIGPVGSGKAAVCAVENDASVKENFHVAASDGGFHVRTLRSEQQCEERELFLLQTARSVVQAALKTALKQLKDELLDSAVHI